MLSKAIGGGQHPLQLLGRATGESAPDLDSFRLNKSSRRPHQLPQPQGSPPTSHVLAGGSPCSVRALPSAGDSLPCTLTHLPVGVFRLPALRDQGRTSRPPPSNHLARAASLTYQDVDNLGQFNSRLMCCELLDVRTIRWSKITWPPWRRRSSPSAPCLSARCWLWLRSGGRWSESSQSCWDRTARRYAANCTVGVCACADMQLRRGAAWSAANKQALVMEPCTTQRCWWLFGTSSPAN